MIRPVTIFMVILIAYSISSAQDRDAQKKLQREVASKTAAFGTISKSDDLYQTARDAHDLASAQKQLG